MNAVYGAMLPQPRLRFLLADEPGTGKTIMAGLYLREMQRLGFVRSALIVVPAHLVTKWQADFERFFGGGLRAITAQTVREHGLDSGHDLWVVSLDLLSVNGAVQDAVHPDRMGWDAVVFDEAHRLTPTAAGYYQAGRTRETCTWSRGAVDVGPRRLVRVERSGRPPGGARRLLAAGRGPVGAAYPYVQHRRLAAPTMCFAERGRRAGSSCGWSVPTARPGLEPGVTAWMTLSACVQDGPRSVVAALGACEPAATVGRVQPAGLTPTRPSCTSWPNCADTPPCSTAASFAAPMTSPAPAWSGPPRTAKPYSKPACTAADLRQPSATSPALTRSLTFQAGCAPRAPQASRAGSLACRVRSWASTNGRI